MAALSLRNTPGGLQKGYGLRNKNQWPDWILLRKNTFFCKTMRMATSETSCLVYNKKNVSYPHERGGWGKHFSPQPHPPGIGSARVGRAPRGHRGDSTSSSGKAKGPLLPNGAAVFLIKIPSHHLHMDTMEANMSTMDLKAIILVAKRRRPKAQKQASNEKWRGVFFSRPALPLCLFCSFK